MIKRRVVVTGIGIISPIGICRSDFLFSLLEARSGKGPISSFDPSLFPGQQVFEVKNFDARSYGVHILDPFIQYAVAAADEAFRDAAFQVSSVDSYRVAISASSSKGGVHTIDRFAHRFHKHPSALLGARIYANSVPNFGAQWIARRWKIRGPAKCYVAACATGTVAVSEGARMVSDGRADYCIAGASDASIVPLMTAGYLNMKAMTRGEMRPFDRRRNGFLIGEGAGMLFLETYESAKARNVPIYGEILDCLYANDGTHLFHFSDQESVLSRSLQKVLSKNHLDPSAIDYINLHGTATRLGDLYETRQIKKAFGEKAYSIPMSSIKSMTGHMLGASGAVEIAATLLAMKEGFIPPTIGLEESDLECDLDYTAGKSRRHSIQKALSISMGFGGHIAVMALSKVS